MSDYPFDLRGRQESFSGWGRKDGVTQKSREFTLTQGIVIVEIEHHGYGDFKLEFIPTEGLSEDQTIAASTATGAVIGSIIPVAGTIVGGLLGAGAGWLVGTQIGPKTWTPVEYKGKVDVLRMIIIKKDENGCLPPGKYRMEVKSEARWTCRFIQPDLGQSFGPLVADADEADYDMGARARVIGPLTSGAKPLLANIQHKGGGGFHAAAFSVDGTHQCVLHEQEGQFHIEDVRTELRPGKEYMLYIGANGNWNLRFTEGY